MRSHINLYSYLSYIFIPEAEIYKHWIKWSAYFQEVRNHQSTVASVTNKRYELNTYVIILSRATGPLRPR